MPFVPFYYNDRWNGFFPYFNVVSSKEITGEFICQITSSFLMPMVRLVVPIEYPRRLWIFDTLIDTLRDVFLCFLLDFNELYRMIFEGGV